MRVLPHRLPIWLAAMALCHPAMASPPGDGAWPETPRAEVRAYLHRDAAGLLIMPGNALPPHAGTIVILNDAQGADGRAAPYVEQLLGAGFAVLALDELGASPMEAASEAAASHVGPVGVLGFGAGARLAARLSGLAAGRALLYPGCAGIANAEVAVGGPVLLHHGGTDPLNAEEDCEGLGNALGRGGHVVRWRVYAGAGYAWDLPQHPGAGPTLLIQPGGAGRVRVHPVPGLAALSAAEVAGFFALAARR